MQHQAQPEEDGGEMLMEMPSFRSISGGQEWPRLLLGYLHDLDDEGRPVEGEAGEEEEFEFCSVSRVSLDGLKPVDADEVFSDGRSRPVFPLFGRALVFEEGGGKPKISEVRIQDGDGDGDHAGAVGRAEESIGLCLSFRDFMTGDGAPPSPLSSSSSLASWELTEELDGVRAETYHVWAPVRAPPSLDLRKKSHSTGASSAASKKWCLRNLVPGWSRSDGKEEKFVLVAAPVSSAAKNKDKKKGKPLPAATSAGRNGRKVATEMDMATAHRLYYLKGGTAVAADRRRSFLPYRKDLFGFFAHVTAAGRGFNLF